MYSVQVSVFCTYWLINRTGLPLVFKQDGVSQVAASQHEENEKASTTSPLLFSYSNGELIESYEIDYDSCSYIAYIFF